MSMAEELRRVGRMMKLRDAALHEEAARRSTRFPGYYLETSKGFLRWLGLEELPPKA